MKLKNITALAAAISFIAPTAILAEDHDDHSKHETKEDHEKGKHDAGDHDGHDHAAHAKKAGPNGGKILMEIDPHLEFFVTEDRKVKITALDHDLKPAEIGEITISVIAGDRKNPIKMKFTKVGDSLISDKAFPEGNDFPVVVSIKTTPDAKKVRSKFNLNLRDCPSCDYLEYACTCDHGDDHDCKDHD